MSDPPFKPIGERDGRYVLALAELDTNGAEGLPWKFPSREAVHDFVFRMLKIRQDS
jgi:hypothetical protein